MTTPVTHGEYDPKSGMMVYVDARGKVYSQEKAIPEEVRDWQAGKIPTHQAAKAQSKSSKSKADAPPNNLGPLGGLWNNPNGLNPQAVVNPANGQTTYRNPVTGKTVPAPEQDGPTADQRAEAQAALAQDNSVAYASAYAQQQAQLKAGAVIYVNGQAVLPVLDGSGNPKKDKNGNVIYAYNGVEQATRPGGDTTVWDALNLGNKSPYSIEGNWQPNNVFLVSRPGDPSSLFGLDDQGNSLDPTKVGYVVGPEGDLIPAPNAGLMNDPQQKAFGTTPRGNIPYTPTGFSEMTVAQSLEALAKLANTHPDRFNGIVNQLKHAGYNSSSSLTGGTALTGGGWSSDVGIAWAKAANDLAMTNAMEAKNGLPQTTMTDFLAAKTAANAQQAIDRYQPTERRYTDPGSLAAAARSAAQELIGRNLTAAELQAFDSQFHGEEDQVFNAEDSAGRAQAAANAQGTSAPGASVTPPSAQGNLETMLQGSGFQGERSTWLGMQYMNAMMQSLGVK